MPRPKRLRLLGRTRHSANPNLAPVDRAARTPPCSERTTMNPMSKGAVDRWNEQTQEAASRVQSDDSVCRSCQGTTPALAPQWSAVGAEAITVERAGVHHRPRTGERSADCSREANGFIHMLSRHSSLHFTSPSSQCSSLRPNRSFAVVCPSHDCRRDWRLLMDHHLPFQSLLPISGGHSRPLLRQPLLRQSPSPPNTGDQGLILGSIPRSPDVVEYSLALVPQIDHPFIRDGIARPGFEV